MITQSHSAFSPVSINFDQFLASFFTISASIYDQSLKNRKNAIFIYTPIGPDSPYLIARFWVRVSKLMLFSNLVTTTTTTTFQWNQFLELRISSLQDSTRRFNQALEKSEATLSVLSIPAKIVRKYASNLDEQKNANSSYPPLSLFWRSMFISAPFQK